MIYQNKVIITFYDLYDNYIGSLPMGDMKMLDFEVETEEVDTKGRYHLINKINEIRRVNDEHCKQFSRIKIRQR